MDLARAPRRAPLTARKKGSGYENGAPSISRHSDNSREICCACARFPLKLEDFPEEITKCSWLFDNFECLFNLYNFFARDKDKVKCTLRFQCIEYLVCV